jgi:starch phosphorylase
MLKEKEQFKAAFLARLQNLHGRKLEEASGQDKYAALVSLVRDGIGRQWSETNQRNLSAGKQAYYFSIEFLLGKLLDCYLCNLGIRDLWQQWLSEIGVDYQELLRYDPELGLGNGGLGRLGACLLDSLATLGIPGHGCGIRYSHGFFEQKIVNGGQTEAPDNWLQNGNMWEYRRSDRAVRVRFGNQETVLAVPYDIPIIGYNNGIVNTLRLWSAEAAENGFDYTVFNQGDYVKAMAGQCTAGAISQILYPSDSCDAGRELRLKQHYFLVSAGLQSIVRYVRKHYESIDCLDKRVAVHINDTHPALAIPELMRILLDDGGMGWEDAWQITVNTISYTNHTTLPEALEKWPQAMFQRVLPRVYEIVAEINERFTKTAGLQKTDDWNRANSMAIIADDLVNMGHLAAVGSHSINGVAKIHSEILKNTVMKPFYQIMPEKFNNKTNGVSHRRWLLGANPKLAALISDIISPAWIAEPKRLSDLAHFATNPEIQKQLYAIKQDRKTLLANHILAKYDIKVDPHSIFDIQVKRIHLYKRQLLNALRVMELYQRSKNNPAIDIPPRTFIFAGKAAPGYFLAKKVIKLINDLAAVINSDKTVNSKIKLVFLENYSVSLAEIIIPAADVSEQISTASKEASGTGNMKFMMNGAITVGTLDGANIEIREAVGEENIVVFGLTAEEVITSWQDAVKSPRVIYDSDAVVKQVIDALIDGTFPEFGEEYRPLFDHLVHGSGEFCELRDFNAFIAAQAKVDDLYQQRQKWGSIAICNIAGSGRFTSDRTAAEYAKDIWQVKPSDNSHMEIRGV